MRKPLERSPEAADTATTNSMPADPAIVEVRSNTAAHVEFLRLDFCLAKLKADFDNGILLVKNDETLADKPSELTWGKVVEKLQRPHFLNPEKTGLEMAADMQGGGQLFGVNEEGRLLIKDRGTEPVMYGFDNVEKVGKPMMIYDRDPGEMANVEKWANYWDAYEAVYGSEGKPTGYELFPDAPDYQKNALIAAAEKVTEDHFVKSANGEDWRSTWLNNGRDSEKKLGNARDVDFNPWHRNTGVRNANPGNESGSRGAVRLLRV